MRRDILVHVDSGDLRLADSFRPIATCRVTETESSVELTVEIEEGYRWNQYMQSGQIPLNIPYIPIDKPFVIKVVKNANGTLSPTAGTLPALLPNGMSIKACALSGISMESYILQKNNAGTAFTVYPGNSLDFTIGNANAQNKAALLSCNPGNSYRYPMIGVGLINWLGSTSNLAGLGQKLMEEFSADGTPVISARYSAEENTVYLDLDTRNVDSNFNSNSNSNSNEDI